MHWQADGLASPLRRSPRGERGLKFNLVNRLDVIAQSLPPRGAWIEISNALNIRFIEIVAPPAGSVD